VIQFENVGLRYGIGPEILRDLTFHIAPRSFQFLSGPSGAGKSSLLRLLFLTLKPTRGLITLFDHDTASLSADSLAVLRRRAGFGTLQVSLVGKAATLCLLYAFPLLFLGDHPGWGGTLARVLGWAFATWGTVLYWWAAMLYITQVRNLVHNTASL